MKGDMSYFCVLMIIGMLVMLYVATGGTFI